MDGHFLKGDCLSWLCKKVEKQRGLGHRIICAFFTSHKIEAITRGTTMCCRQTLQRVTTCWLFLPSKIMTTAYYTNGGLYNRGRGRSQGLLRAWHTLDKCFLLGIRFRVNCVFRTLVPNLWRQMCLSTYVRYVPLNLLNRNATAIMVLWKSSRSLHYFNSLYWLVSVHM